MDYFLLIYNEFITKQEEEQFMSMVEPHLKCYIYAPRHGHDNCCYLIK